MKYLKEWFFFSQLKAERRRFYKTKKCADKHTQCFPNRHISWLYIENSDKHPDKTTKLAEALKMFVLTLWGTLGLQFHPAQFSIFVPLGYIIDAMRKKLFVRHSRISVYSHSKNYNQIINSHVVDRRCSGFGCLSDYVSRIKCCLYISSKQQLNSYCLQIIDPVTPGI